MIFFPYTTGFIVMRLRGSLEVTQDHLRSLAHVTFSRGQVLSSQVHWKLEPKWEPSPCQIVVPRSIAARKMTKPSFKPLLITLYLHYTKWPNTWKSANTCEMELFTYSGWHCAKHYRFSAISKKCGGGWIISIGRGLSVWKCARLHLRVLVSNTRGHQNMFKSW